METILNGDHIGTVADLQGKDAIAELLIAALDNQAIDSSVEEVLTALV